MYRIGEFSKITGASIKTLRYYDEINLLNPSEVDPFTNYRIYTNKEIQIYERINYLKKIGFTLEEIKNNLNNLTVEFLNQKQMELESKKDLIMSQILEIENLKNSFENKKVKSLIKKAKISDYILL